MSENNKCDLCDNRATHDLGDDGKLCDECYAKEAK